MIIVKVGGGEKINIDYVCEDFASLFKKEKVVLIHGASAKRDEIARRLGHPTRTIISPSGVSSVYTDRAALEIFLMVYAGLVNKQITAKLQKLGVNAVGLSGIDGHLLEGERKREILAKEGDKIKLLKDNLTGKVKKINADFINLLIENGFCPVICPPAISYEGDIINVDSDMITALLAKKLKAQKIIFLFEAPGLLKNAADEKSLINRIDRNEIGNYLQFAQGRMKKKILAAKEAVESGAKEIYFGDGRIKNPITSALQGRSTVIS